MFQSQTHDSRQESSESEGTTRNRNPKTTLQFYRSAYFKLTVWCLTPSLQASVSFGISTIDLGVILGESSDIPPADVEGEEAPQRPAAVCHLSRKDGYAC